MKLSISYFYYLLISSFSFALSLSSPDKASNPVINSENLKYNYADR